MIGPPYRPVSWSAEAGDDRAARSLDQVDQRRVHSAASGLIAGSVSYLHMYTLVAFHGQPGWAAALTPLSVDGIAVAASTTLLADLRSGQRAGVTRGPAACIAEIMTGPFRRGAACGPRA